MQHNPFTTKRDIEAAPLHVSDSFDEKLKPKSFSLYHSDIQKLHDMKSKMKTKSRKKLNDSMVIRVALAHLEETLLKGGDKVEREIKRLLLENA